MGYGIDIGSSAVKVIGMRRGLGGFKVTAAVRRRLPPIGEGDPKPVYQKLIQNALAGPNGSRTGVVGLSGRDINLQIVQQPNMKALNYRQMMRYELDQRRGEATDLYMDYCTLREPDQYFPQYLALIGIGKSDYVEGRIDLLARTGVDVRDAVPNAFALFTAYKNAYDTEGGTILLLDIGSDNMDLAFVRGGRLIFARNVSSGARIFDTQMANMLGLEAMEEAEALKVTKGNLGAGDEEEDERAQEIRAAIRGAAGQLTGSITSSINYAKLQLQDRDLTIDKIYISGGGARIRGLTEYLAGVLKTPVEVLDPFGKLDLSTIEKQGGAEVRTLPTDMAVAIGLAQLVAPPPGAASLSILPEEIKTRRDRFRTTYWMATAGIIFAAVLVLLTGLAWMRKSSNESARAAFMRDNQEVSTRIDDLNEAEKAQHLITAKSDYLLAHVSPGRGLLDVIARLRRQQMIVEEKSIRLLGVRLIDPTGDVDATPGNRRRVVFRRVGGGFVVGDLSDESDRDRIVLARDPEHPIPDEEVVDGIRDGVIEYDSEILAIRITGEVDENVRGGPRAALNKLRDALTDERRRMRAQVGRQRDADRPGWRKFDIMVRFD